MKMSIVVKLSFEAVHNWPECPIPEVEFLKHPHRHVFHVRAERLVSHNDRDTEIIMFKRDMQEYIRAMTQLDSNIGRMSCEDIAERLMTKFGCSLVEVLEDGENGAIARAE